MSEIFLKPQKISHNDYHLSLKYDGGETDPFSLTQGIEISVYRGIDNLNDPANPYAPGIPHDPNVLKAKIIAKANSFDKAAVYSKVLFKAEAIDADIYGGFIKKVGDYSDHIQLAEATGGNITNIHIALKEVFHLSIIGVDDIRAKLGAPNYNQIYLMEGQKLHLKLDEENANEVRYLHINYIRRTIFPV